MDIQPAYPSLSERIASFWERGLRIATRFAVAFGLSTLTGIGIGFSVTDNVLAQILVTILSAFALWIPFFVAVVRFEGWRVSRRNRKAMAAQPVVKQPNKDFEQDWKRLLSLAPTERSRLSAIKSSIERSRLELGRGDLDPGAHDLCVLIDRRLPELIRHELDDLPPDDANRRRRVGELIELVEQFARHCSRDRDHVSAGKSREAAILRRRFEARLSDRGDGL